MSSLLLILLSAVLINTVAISRVPAWRPFAGLIDAFGMARAVAVASLLIVPLAAALNWLLADILLPRWELEYLRTLAAVAVLLIVVSIVETALRRYSRFLPQRPGFALLMTANGVGLGVALVAQAQTRSFFGALFVAIGAAVALGILLLALVSMHERLRGADTPAVFREAPLALVTTGLIALGFMGFSGLIQE